MIPTIRHRRLPSLPIALAIVAGVASCSPHRDDAAALSTDDRRQLNEAAVILDANTIEAAGGAAHESSPHD